MNSSQVSRGSAAPDDDEVGPNYFDAQGQPLFRGRVRRQAENEGYAFGHEMSQEERFRSRDWDDFDDELRLTWKQRYPGMSFDEAKGDIIRGWTDELVGPDPDEIADISGALEAEYGEMIGPGSDEGISLFDVTGEAPFGDLGDTVRIVSSEEMVGKIDMHYVDDMTDLSDLPDIENPGNRGDDTAHLA